MSENIRYNMINIDNFFICDKIITYLNIVIKRNGKLTERLGRKAMDLSSFRI